MIIINNTQNISPNVNTFEVTKTSIFHPKRIMIHDLYNHTLWHTVINNNISGKFLARKKLKKTKKTFNILYTIITHNQ